MRAGSVVRALRNAGGELLGGTMLKTLRIVFVVVSALVVSRIADAQTAAPGASAEHEWHVTVYPVLAWVPLDIAIDVNVPPAGGGDGDGDSGQILNSRF